MHKFAKNVDFSHLKNCTLTQIIVGRYQLTLTFEEPFLISVEYGLEYVRAKTKERFRYDIQSGLGPIFFHEVLQERITAIEVQDLTFTITFESGNKICVLTEDGGNESGEIRGESIGVYVF